MLTYEYACLHFLSLFSIAESTICVRPCDVIRILWRSLYERLASIRIFSIISSGRSIRLLWSPRETKQMNIRVFTVNQSLITSIHIASKKFSNIYSPLVPWSTISLSSSTFAESLEMQPLILVNFLWLWMANKFMTVWNKSQWYSIKWVKQDDYAVDLIK